MHAPTFHHPYLPAGDHVQWREEHRSQLAKCLHVAARIWDGFKVFYGVGAIGIVLAVFVAVGGDAAKLMRHTSAAPAARAAEWSMPAYTNQVIYVVGSQLQADNLMAYGAGLPTFDPSQMLPNAKVTVMIATTPQGEANVRVTMDRIMAAQAGSSPLAIQMIDLR